VEKGFLPTPAQVRGNFYAAQLFPLVVDPYTITVCRKRVDKKKKVKTQKLDFSD
jgi:hypothetical protein